MMHCDIAEKFTKNVKRVSTIFAWREKRSHGALPDYDVLVHVQLFLPRAYLAEARRTDARAACHKFFCVST